ncbi:DNA alkylation repair protein [Bacillus sp. 2205SS5-2]|uniref:DNA alkylation repair protein n=1 Tax=Bacillus sp. 2205SS5-2 TaxID=3109031 RepID=UPI003007DAFA
MTYSQTLTTYFRFHQNDESAPAMEQYMRNQFSYLGIKTPERNALLKSFLKEYGKPRRVDYPFSGKLIP